MENEHVANIFDEIADLLELEEGNRFRVRAYRNAARAVRNVSERLEDAVDAGRDLTEISDIGGRTASKILEILETGTCERLEELRKEVPSELTKLMEVPQLGPRKAMQLYKELGVTTLKQLRKACEDGNVRELEGMGEKSEAAIRKGVATVETTSGRLAIDKAEAQVEVLAKHLEGLGAVQRWVVTGSYRRRKETVGDLDILLRATDRKKATAGLLEFDAIADVLGKGREKISVRLGSGLQVDFRFFKAGAFGAAMLYFTGSQAHNIRLRKIAREHDWKLNEYGLFKSDRRLAGKTEASVYKRLNLPWIPPELREDRGEVDAALDDNLPGLIEADDVRGDLHCHTDATDGADTLEAMGKAAASRGYRYLALTDHSKAVRVAGGLDDDALRKRADEIRAGDDDFDDVWLLAGVEVDILKSGKLDLKAKTLAGLDWVVASVHSYFNLGKKQMTERIVRAVESGVVHCLGHPTARMLGRREPIPFDTEKVFTACREHGVALEIDAQPERLDLPDTFCREARDAGCRFSIASDAHRTGELALIRYGVDVARRGWLRRKDVLNTRTVRQMKKTIERT
jgi:DNA polymerase (family 10)